MKNDRENTSASEALAQSPYGLDHTEQPADAPAEARGSGVTPQAPSDAPGGSGDVSIDPGRESPSGAVQRGQPRNEKGQFVGWRGRNPDDEAQEFRRNLLFELGADVTTVERTQVDHLAALHVQGLALMRKLRNASNSKTLEQFLRLQREFTRVVRALAAGRRGSRPKTPDAPSLQEYLDQHAEKNQ